MAKNKFDILDDDEVNTVVEKASAKVDTLGDKKVDNTPKPKKRTKRYSLVFDTEEQYEECFINAKEDDRSMNKFILKALKDAGAIS